MTTQTSPSLLVDKTLGCQLRAALTLALLATLGRVTAEAQAAPNPWFARIAGGVATHDGPVQYASLGLAYGADVGRAISGRLAARLTVTRTQHIARCAGVGGGIGGFGDCSIRQAPDHESTLLIGIGPEWRPMSRGLFAYIALGVARRSGSALGDEGILPAAMVAVGLQLSTYVRAQVAFLRFVGTSSREAWSLPITLSLGP